jgi:hypothetical protein
LPHLGAAEMSVENPLMMYGSVDVSIGRHSRSGDGYVAQVGGRRTTSSGQAATKSKCSPEERAVEAAAQLLWAPRSELASDV